MGDNDVLDDVLQTGISDIIEYQSNTFCYM